MTDHTLETLRAEWMHGWAPSRVLLSPAPQGLPLPSDHIPCRRSLPAALGRAPGCPIFSLDLSSVDLPHPRPQALYPGSSPPPFFLSPFFSPQLYQGLIDK